MYGIDNVARDQATSHGLGSRAKMKEMKKNTVSGHALTRLGLWISGSLFSESSHSRTQLAHLPVTDAAAPLAVCCVV